LNLFEIVTGIIVADSAVTMEDFVVVCHIEAVFVERKSWGDEGRCGAGVGRVWGNEAWSFLKFGGL
jgi:hypothetical protein